MSKRSCQIETEIVNSPSYNDLAEVVQDCIYEAELVDGATKEDLKVALRNIINLKVDVLWKD